MEGEEEKEEKIECEKPKKKLIILDVNGLLVDTYFQKTEELPSVEHDAKIGGFYVYKRPLCDEFLNFCLENFVVGIWSSAKQRNVDRMIDYVFGDRKEQLAFTWSQSQCTDSGRKSLANKYKPVFLKELSKVWNMYGGEYDPSNTLLIDDTPYKILRNPEHTAILPYTYTVKEMPDDRFLSVLQRFLEGLVTAGSVQEYVKQNDIAGQSSITSKHPQWRFYERIKEIVKDSEEDSKDSKAADSKDAVEEKEHHRGLSEDDVGGDDGASMKTKKRRYRRNRSKRRPIYRSLSRSLSRSPSRSRSRSRSPNRRHREERRSYVDRSSYRERYPYGEEYPQRHREESSPHADYYRERSAEYRHHYHYRMRHYQHQHQQQQQHQHQQHQHQHQLPQLPEVPYCYEYDSASGSNRNWHHVYRPPPFATNIWRRC